MSSSRLVSYFTICLIMGSIVALSALSINVVADGSEEDPLAEAGLTLIALRNDTLDTNQDGKLMRLEWL